MSLMDLFTPKTLPRTRQIYYPAEKTCRCGRERFLEREERELKDGTTRVMLVLRCTRRECAQVDASAPSVFNLPHWRGKEK